MQRSCFVGLFCILSIPIAASSALAQRAGGQRPGAGGAGGKPAPGQTPEERERAANAKQWQTAIDQVRASSAPPPLPKIRFPSANESFLGSLRWAENPKQDLAKYLDKLWKDGKEPTAQRTAVAGLWEDAAKPVWARPAIEEFYRQRSNGQSLKSAPEPASLAAPAPTAAGVAPEPTVVTGTSAAPTGAAPEPATVAAPTKRGGEAAANKP